MISPDSRYRDVGTTVVESDRGVVVTLLPRSRGQWAFKYTYYRWTGADRLDLLATRFYGDPRMWWMLADANPEILDWSQIPAGTILRVPSG